jgi:hypothetical protein
MVYSYRIGTFGYKLNELRTIQSKNGIPMTFKLLENGWKQVSNSNTKKKKYINKKKKIKKLKLPTELVHICINEIERIKKKFSVDEYEYVDKCVDIVHSYFDLNNKVELDYILPNISYNSYCYTLPPSYFINIVETKEYSIPRGKNLTQSPIQLIFSSTN